MCPQKRGKITKLRGLALFVGLLVLTPFSHGAKMLHPDFPVIEGRYQMTKEWSVTLPEKFNRRIEDGDLVIWRPGVTLWIAAWGNDKNENADVRLKATRDDISPKAFDIQTSKTDHILRLTYRLREGNEQGAVPAYYCFAFGDTGHVQMAIYLDHERDVKSAQTICGSLSENNAR
ncbi:hypothetical protein [Parathalassolituus penaei]|uniref:Uncharacterized protein n=1 Tax=Parathalassolituus penaei TaxID=2997323 RepID=A0A9X3IQS1_9GAMM|nr:hypothetical protein [Parathalassolituus penaei]MCY0964086.1 hypothetical protein [Parathalassolituus penaei]